LVQVVLWEIMLCRGIKIHSKELDENDSVVQFWRRVQRRHCRPFKSKAVPATMLINEMELYGLVIGYPESLMWGPSF
jgi:hypothetical protein